MFKLKLVSICALLVIIAVLNPSVEAKKKKMVLKEKETNPVNFMRLAVMRLVYGLATRMGLEEQISEAAGGAFVPPGVDDYYGDYASLDLLDRDDDYDY